MGFELGFWEACKFKVRFQNMMQGSRFDLAEIQKAHFRKFSLNCTFFGFLAIVKMVVFQFTSSHILLFGYHIKYSLHNVIDRFLTNLGKKF